MDSNDLEFVISQYSDGALDEPQRSAIEVRLRTDAVAQSILAEHQAVTSALRQAALPAVNWDLLASSISEAVDRAEEPAQSYRIRPAWVAIPLGLAASVLIVAGIAFHVFSSSGTVGPV